MTQLSFLPPRVAIVGSRDFPYLAWVRQYVELVLEPGTVVVSGGARGVDAWAEAAARAREDLPDPIVLPASWRASDGSLDRSAGHKRNKDVVARCDRLTAFWDGVSPGTADVIAQAEAAGRPVRILRPAMMGTPIDPVYQVIRLRSGA